MDNLNFSITSGGYYKCTQNWSNVKINRDNCFKLYFPTEGNASIKVSGKWYQLNAGNVYFINGFMLEAQECNHYMQVYWLHFLPQSQELNIVLNKFSPVFSWNSNDSIAQQIEYKKIVNLFENAESSEAKPIKSVSLSLISYINAVILLLVSDMSEKQASDISNNIPMDIFSKIQPAVEYINTNFRSNLTLDEISQQVFLNKVYFIRIFKKCFNMTPNIYLNMLRLNEATILLSRTNMSIQQISNNLGFCNQFYFSKVFKSRFNCTPVEYRRYKMLP